MTNLDLDAIEARANAATDGPWLGYDERSDLREENPDVNPMWVVAHMEPDGVNWVRDIADIGGGEQDEADAEFIAHARTDVPALVAALREARAKVARWEADFPCDQGCRDYPDEACSRHGRRPADLWNRSDQAFRERDDLRRRYDALRDAVLGHCADFPFPIDQARALRAVVARVEGDES